MIAVPKHRSDARKNNLLQQGLSGAFVSDGFKSLPYVPTVKSRLLGGLRLAVKDVFQVQGLRTGAGNPEWHKEQAKSGYTAFAVDALLGAGAEWIGKTVTDELAFSLAGTNLHYGTPINPACPDRLPGGSSSGSAVAVAAGHADIGLATDCGGSARLPGSYCGVWGMRPSQGLVGGVSGFALAPSFDTVGWFARTGEVMEHVLDVLSPDKPGVESCEWLGSSDASDVCDPRVRHAYNDLIRTLKDEAPVNWLPRGALPLKDWAVAHRTMQGAEIWSQHGEWVKCRGQALAPFIRERFAAISRLNFADVREADRLRHRARSEMASMLGEKGVLIVPTTPDIAPLLGSTAEALVDIRERSHQLLAPAGLAGLPQVTLPWTTVNNAPVGLSVIGGRGFDRQVLRAAIRLEEIIRGRQGESDARRLND
ncbi:amidase [Caballeronia insecticola]|uniref:Putative amidase n=1 Tax=Caballeronia insecticola TaxID=758793 RepID=A0A060PGX7_9BURK|nr:amidase [Caballeronia insecticola]BAO94037.1 putative amidase [Caballeronia insecticola]